MNDAGQMVVRDEPGDVGLVAWKDYVSEDAFIFASGDRVPNLVLRYETYGRLNAERSNAVLVCHALSGDHHCAGVHTIHDRKPGWWDNLIGPGKALDTRKYFVICSNCLGGCQGSTGPSSLDPASGRPYGLEFPVVTIEDMVRAQERLLREEFAIERLHCVIGGSMGGMQALQWAISFPGKVARIIAMATTGRQSAQAIAFNEVGRLAILRDPKWENGKYLPGEGPRVGLAIARMMAHITYLSDRGLEEKFGRARREWKEAKSLFDVEFEVESYLRYQGKSFINRFDANSYLYFTKALDRFDLFGGGGRMEDTLAVVEARALVVGFSSDWLFPPEQNRALVHALLRCGKVASYAELEMDLGHDSFLVHAPDLYRLVKGMLAS